MTTTKKRECKCECHILTPIRNRDCCHVCQPQDTKEECKHAVEEWCNKCVPKEIGTVSSPPPIKGWEKRFKNTKFAKGGGLSFECSDYEGMYDNLISFISKEIAQAQEEERKRVIEEIKEWSDNESKVQEERVIKLNDINKAQLVGYASGVISRMCREVFKKEEGNT